MRILIVAENVSTEMGGEAALPFHLFKVLREREVEAWLVTHDRVRNFLKGRIPLDLDRIHYVNDSRFDKISTRIGSSLHWKLREQTIGVVLQGINQVRLRGLARRVVRAERIDLVHQAYPVSPKAPSAIFGLGVPVVIGPLAGGMDYPPAFQDRQGRLVRGIERLGRGASHLLNHLLPGKVRADAVIVANPQTRAALPLGARGRVHEVSDVSFDPGTFRPGADGPGARPEGAAIRFVYLGRLIEWKGVDLLLEAFRRAVEGAGDLELALEILGEGQERPALEAQAGRLGLGGRVQFAGWVAADEAAARLGRSDVFVLPSLRECGGIVLLEAMALGLPVITTDWGGPAVHVDEASGIRVAPASHEGFVSGLAEAMLRLARSPELRSRMGRAARERVQGGTYTWDRKIDRILEIYRETLDGASARRAPQPPQPPSSAATGSLSARR